MASEDPQPSAAQAGGAATEQHDPAGELRATAEDAGAAIPRAMPANIFVSYRVRPDEPIATALKTLLEGAIDPRPKVFVSGVGGILPSEETSRAQMQSAAQAASAFVAVITDQSKDREWIFFEAGAAWGRRVLYAPLLVKVAPEELPNTIQDYQATPYDDDDKVRELVREIATKLGGLIKTRAFPYKYKDFVRAISEHLGLRRPSDDEGREHTIDYAIDLIVEGSDAAEAILNKYSPNDALVRDHVAVMRIEWAPGLTSCQRLERLENETGLHRLLSAKLAFARWEPAPHLALRHAQDALTLSASPNGDPWAHKTALDLVVTHLNLLERTREAHALLTAALRDPRRLVRAAAALRLTEESFRPPLARFGHAALAAFAAASHPAPETVLAAARLLHGQSYTALFAHLAQMADALARSPESAHWLGLAFLGDGTQSVAYRALKRAAEGGLQLAYVNMASLLGRGAVPAAGLELLAGNSGPYEAASNKYPYSVRADLEETVQNDETRATELLNRGKTHFSVLVATMDEALSTGRPSPSISDGRYTSDIGGAYEVTDTDGTFSFFRDKTAADEKSRRTFVLYHNYPIPGLATLDGAEDAGLIYISGPNGALTIVWFRNVKSHPAIVIEQLTLIDSTVPAVVAQVTNVSALAAVLAR